MTAWFRRGTAVVVATGAAAALLFVGAASAATSISQPTGNPYHVTLDAQGRPVSFTVVASGFPQFTSVFIEQCDDRLPSAPNWSPTVDCDAATGQAPAVADKQHNARFDAADPSLAFKPFVGASPQSLFNCLAPGQKSPGNGLPDFHSCQIRVASNPVRATTDQAFLPIVFGAAGAASTSSSSSSSWIWLVLGVAAVAVLVAGTIAFTRRRAAARSRPSGSPSERALRRR